MILAAASLLGATGLTLVAVSAVGLKQRREVEQSQQDDSCAAFSPDDNLQCAQELGHFGWHRSGATSWFGDAWECDHWADTQESPAIGHTDDGLEVVEAEVEDPDKTKGPSMPAGGWPKPKPPPARQRSFAERIVRRLHGRDTAAEAWAAARAAAAAATASAEAAKAANPLISWSTQAAFVTNSMGETLAR